MTTVVVIISSHALRIENYHTSQCYKTKVAFYKLLLLFTVVGSLKHLYKSNKMEFYNYSGGCGICLLRKSISIYDNVHGYNTVEAQICYPRYICMVEHS